MPPEQVSFRKFRLGTLYTLDRGEWFVVRACSVLFSVELRKMLRTVTKKASVEAVPQR